MTHDCQVHQVLWHLVHVVACVLYKSQKDKVWLVLSYVCESATGLSSEPVSGANAV